jgi:glycosyltransferase involved in cell wall biosynthesis
MKYKLTICIATYNRDKFLDNLLSNIVDQIKDLELISVLVVDGNSSDNTNEICKKFTFFPRFEFIKLSEKGGIDKDFDIAVRKANSEFCWLFCDDDSIVDGGILEVYNKLLGEKPDLMIINSSVSNYDLSKILKLKSVEIDSDIIIDHEPTMQDQLFELCRTYLTFTGALLFRREKWCKVVTSRFYGNRFGDMCTIAQFDGNDSKVLILERPLVLIRLGNAEWSDISFKIWFDYYPKIIHNDCNLSTRVRSILCPDNIYWFIKFLLWHRSMGSFSFPHYQKYFFDSVLTRKYIAFIISIIPRFLPWSLFYITALLRNDALAIHDLGEGRLSRNTWKSTD